MLISQTNKKTKFLHNKNYNNYKPANKSVTFVGRLIDNSAALNELNHFKYFNIQEYLKLTDNAKRILRNLYNDTYSRFVIPSMPEEILKTHQYSASIMKSALENQFGKDNYIVLTIGRSLSSIGKVLSYKIGENNVKNIPMSGAAMYNNPLKISTEEIKGGIDKFKKFLESINLSKKEVLTSNKNYILADYCFT